MEQRNKKCPVPVRSLRDCLKDGFESLIANQCIVAYRRICPTEEYKEVRAEEEAAFEAVENALGDRFFEIWDCYESAANYRAGLYVNAVYLQGLTDGLAILKTLGVDCAALDGDVSRSLAQIIEGVHPDKVTAL